MVRIADCVTLNPGLVQNKACSVLGLNGQAFFIQSGYLVAVCEDSEEKNTPPLCKFSRSRHEPFGVLQCRNQIKVEIGCMPIVSRDELNLIFKDAIVGAVSTMATNVLMGRNSGAEGENSAG